MPDTTLHPPALWYSTCDQPAVYLHQSSPLSPGPPAREPQLSRPPRLTDLAGEGKGGQYPVGVYVQGVPGSCRHMRRQGCKMQARVEGLYVLQGFIHAVVRQDQRSHRLGSIQESLQQSEQHSYIGRSPAYLVQLLRLL